MRLENPTYDNKKENLPPTTNSSTSVDLSKECDVEDITKPSPTLIERDRVREYLEKNPKDRTEKDIQFLLDFMQHMPAFSNMTMSMKRSLCRVMVFALVERAGTVVLKDGEKLDSWSVILNGHVEVAKPDGTIQHLHMGDSFGVTITRDTMLQEGVMTTKSDDCQFVCIPQDDFYDILHREKENIIKIEDASGEVVMVMEKRESEERGNFVQGKVVLRATPDMLMKQLMEDNVMDETYTSDFLLTYRTFMKSPVELADYLLTCLRGTNADKAVQVVHAWVLNHFVDFESNTELFGKLEKFIDALKEKNMLPQVTHLQQTCSDRARMRHVLFVLKNDEEPLQFVLAGGQERNSKIFVSHVDEKSPASKAGLRVADQIISVNNHNLDGITLEKAYEFLQMTNHLMLTVKSNLLDFEKLKMKASPRDCTSPASPALNDQTTAPKQASEWGRARLLPGDPDGSLSSSDSPLRGGKRSDQSPQASRLRQALGKMNLMQKSETCENYTGFRNSISSTSGILDSSSLSNWSNNISFNQSVDLQNASKSSALFPLGSSCRLSQEDTSAVVVYRADQTHKHILVKRSTTVQEAIEALLLEFEIPDSPGQYSLCQITLDEDGTVKTKHLPNHVSDLAERCTLNSRYYLRDIRRMEKLITGDLTSVLSTDVNFLQLPFAEVASQLTQRDMQLFCSIDPVEYVNDLFEISSVPQLTRFSELVNEEMFWVVTEVCSEPNCLKRSKILKQFIKIAEKCHKLKNFNSMFAVLSGLGHGSVSRLRQTWEKLPDKYCKLFEEMQGVMDPSRNMLKYRNLLLSSQPPLIPFFPLVKKDLTFIHFGNDSRIDGLINFDKLRMIAKEIRLIFKMASVSSSDKLSTSKNSMESLISSGSSSSLISVTPSKKFAAPFASSASLTTPSINALNAKKIYEEGQTSRTVKTYIANLKIISDENKLSVMSLTCESNGKSSRKPVPSSASIVCRPVSSCEVTGPRFGSENPTAIMKIMSLSETIKPLNSVVKNISSSPANSKKVSSDKNKTKPQLPHLHLSMESSSVSNVRKNNAEDILARPSNVTPSSSNSSLSLSSSSSSSSSNENKSCPTANDKITEMPAQLLMLSSSSSSSSHVTSQLPADNLSSSMSSGICSLESASSLHHHHHHHHHQQHVQQICNCCDVDIGDELDNLPDDGVDDDDDDYDGGGDDDDDDYDDAEPVNAGSSCHDNLPFIGKEHGSNGTLCRSDSSTPSSKRQSIDVDLDPDVSPNQTSSPSTFSDPNSPLLRITNTEAVQTSAVYKNKTDATANGSRLPSRPHQNSVRQLFREDSKHLDHRSSPSSPNSYVAHQKSSSLLPSYDQLLSMKQNVPSHGRPPNQPHLPRSKPQSSIPSPVDSHSKCCCCSVCFQSSYHYHHHHHHHHYLPRNSALDYCNGSSNSKVVSFASPEISLPQQQQKHQQQHHPKHQVPSGFSRGFQNVNPSQQHPQHFNEPLMTTNHVAPRSCDQLRKIPNACRSVPPYYQPYATVHEDDDGELVTLV